MTESNAGATRATTTPQELQRRLAVEVGSAPALEKLYITRSKQVVELTYAFSLVFPYFYLISVYRVDDTIMLKIVLHLALIKLFKLRLLN